MKMASQMPRGRVFRGDDMIDEHPEIPGIRNPPQTPQTNVGIPTASSASGNMFQTTQPLVAFSPQATGHAFGNTATGLFGNGRPVPIGETPEMIAERQETSPSSLLQRSAYTTEGSREPTEEGMPAAGERQRLNEATPTRQASGQKREAKRSVSPIDDDDKHRHKRPQQLTAWPKVGSFTEEEAYLAIPKTKEETQLELICRRYPAAKKYETYNWLHNRPMRWYHDPVTIVCDLEYSTAKDRSVHKSYRVAYKVPETILAWRGSAKKWDEVFDRDARILVPYIPTFDMFAVNYYHTPEKGDYPKKVYDQLKRADMQFMVDGGDIPEFFEGMKLDDTVWRRDHLDAQDPPTTKGMDVKEIRTLPELLRQTFPVRHVRDVLMGEDTEWETTDGETKNPFQTDIDTSLFVQFQEPSVSDYFQPSHAPQPITGDKTSVAESSEYPELTEQELETVTHNPFFKADSLKDAADKFRTAKAMMSAISGETSGTDLAKPTEKDKAGRLPAMADRSEMIEIGEDIADLRADQEKSNDDHIKAHVRVREKQANVFVRLHGALASQDIQLDKMANQLNMSLEEYRRLMDQHKKLAMDRYRDMQRIEQLEENRRRDLQRIERLENILAKLTGEDSTTPRNVTERRVVSEGNQSHDFNRQVMQRKPGMTFPLQEQVAKEAMAKRQAAQTRRHPSVNSPLSSSPFSSSPTTTSPTPAIRPPMFRGAFDMTAGTPAAQQFRFNMPAQTLTLTAAARSGRPDNRASAAIPGLPAGTNIATVMEAHRQLQERKGRETAANAENHHSTVTGEVDDDDDLYAA